MLISLGVLAFYAIQRASQAGWSIVLFRVMEGITGYLLIGCISVLIILLMSGLHFNHLFIWMDPDVVAHDEIIRNKTSYLNLPFFFIRAIIYVSGWVLYRNITRIRLIIFLFYVLLSTVCSPYGYGHIPNPKS